MNNKLSELSKPVGHFRKQPDGSYWPLSKSTATMDMVPLYSQEYVSALLAELEAKDKRIAELERDRDTWQAGTLAMRDSWREERAELEAKLAAPVRLKKVDSSNVPFAGDGFNAAVDYCAKAVRTAGFKVEGDE
ncbi:MAG: hypothetical protein E7G96_02445 [Serratia liquefaciens]|nr:hypothetical protein [Serratia liquefaciens]